MAKYKKARPKVRGKKDVIDEWETMDIDRDEQERGLKRRERRWKEIEREQQKARRLEEKAIEKAGEIKPSLRRPPTPLELAWLKCDYVLNHIMQKPAYDKMEDFRAGDIDCYKFLYKVFMSRYMMEHIDSVINFFAGGGLLQKKIPLGDVIKYYRKYKGIKSKIVVKHKGDEEHDL